MQDDSQVKIRAVLFDGINDQNGNCVQLGKVYEFSRGKVEAELSF